MLVRRFPRAAASLPALVAFVREFFATRGWDADEAFDVDLVIEELFTNMVRHARGGKPEIEVGLEGDGTHVTVRLRDEDVEPWDPDQAPAPNLALPIEQRRPGGLGIHFLRQLCRELRFEHADRVTTVTAVLPAPR
jgi:anti-sigma regulatory factor (Ser/Thr protein kinase)